MARGACHQLSFGLDSGIFEARVASGRKSPASVPRVMATEPHFPLWIGDSTNELPTEIGKFLTGQDDGGDAKKCMDAVAKVIDAQTKDAGLL